MAKFHKRILSAATITLLLWLNGFGCAMCCVKDATADHCNTEAVAAAPQTSSVNAKPEAEIACQSEAPEKAELDCCKRPVSKNSAALSATSSKRDEAEGRSEKTPLKISRQGKAVACSLLPKQLPGVTVAPKSFVNSDGEIAVSASILITAAQPSETPTLPPALPQNRSGTYLRCCVFLI